LGLRPRSQSNSCQFVPFQVDESGAMSDRPGTTDGRLSAFRICEKLMLGNKWQWSNFSVTGSIRSNEEITMRKLAIALLAGAGALFTGSANAADVYTSNEYANAELVQQVRLICDESGRCYRTQGGRRVIVEDSYNYAPRERYIERRGYRDWDDGPRAGVGFRAPGVSVGVGVGNDRW
jgi:hypothetical protein